MSCEAVKNKSIKGHVSGSICGALRKKEKEKHGSDLYNLYKWLNSWVPWLSGKE